MRRLERQPRGKVGIRRDLRVERLARRLENGSEAAELVGNDDNGGDDENINHRVFDERDHGRRAQAALVGEERENDERDGDRRMRHDPLAGEAERQNDLLEADELQRDIRHRRQDAGRRDRKLQSFVAVAAKHEIGGGDVAMFLRDRPQARQRQVQERIDNDRIGHGEEAEGANGEDERGNRDDRVGGVEIAPEQEPGDPTAEAPASKAPFVDVAEIGGLPTRRDEAEHRHQAEKEHEDGGGDDVEVVEHAQFLPTRSAARIARAEIGIRTSWNQKKNGMSKRDGRNRIVERDPERQNTGDKQKEELHCSPRIGEQAMHLADDVMSSVRLSKFVSPVERRLCFELRGALPADAHPRAIAFALVIIVVTSSP